MMRPWPQILALLACVTFTPTSGCSKRESPPAVRTPAPRNSLHGEVPSTVAPQRYGRPAGKPLEPDVQPAQRGPELPKVVLTEAHEALCQVRVRDRMPEMQLPDLDGNVQILAGQYGPQLTVICFWRGDRALARAELADLGPDVAVAYSGRGVHVVGIAVEETAESARQHVAEAGASFPMLVDADGSAFAKVGSDKLPRTYLLDAKGTILWFDIEYSRTTRRDLQQAIRAALGEESRN